MGDDVAHFGLRGVCKPKQPWGWANVVNVKGTVTRKRRLNHAPGEVCPLARGSKSPCAKGSARDAFVASCLVQVVATGVSYGPCLTRRGYGRLLLPNE